MNVDGLIIMKPQKFNQYNDIYNVRDHIWIIPLRIHTRINKLILVRHLISECFDFFTYYSKYYIIIPTITRK